MKLHDIIGSSLPLIEMLIRYRSGDGSVVVAFQDSIWLLDDRPPARVLTDIRRRTGLRGRDLDQMQSDARDSRPDVLVGNVDRVNNTLWIDGIVSIKLNPRSSLLIKRVVQQLGLDGVNAERIGPDSDEYSDEYQPADLEGRIPEVVYHGTNSTAIRDILRLGLVPNRGIGNWKKDVGKFNDKVFLTVRLDDATYHANHSTEQARGIPLVIATRIPDRNRIVPDYDVTKQLLGANRQADREGYTASIRQHQDKWEKSATQRFKKFDRETDYNREIGVFGYRGRIPASFFRAFFVPPDTEPLAERSAMRVDTIRQLMVALEQLNEFGFYDPNFRDEDDQPDDD